MSEKPEFNIHSKLSVDRRSDLPFGSTYAIVVSFALSVGPERKDTSCARSRSLVLDIYGIDFVFLSPEFPTYDHVLSSPPVGCRFGGFPFPPLISHKTEAAAAAAVAAGTDLAETNSKAS